MFTKHAKSMAGKILCLILTTVLVFSSCKKEEEPVPAIPGAEPIAEQPQQPSDPSTPPNTTPPDSGTNQPDPDTEECIVKTAADHNAFIPNQYIVTYSGDIAPTFGVKSNPVDQLLAKHNISATKILKQFEGLKIKGFVAQLSPEDLKKLKSDSKIQNIEQDRIIHITSGCYQEASTQKIPWGVERVGYGSGAGKTAWVIDTGVDLDHPDLIIDKIRSASFIPGTSVDDDHGHGTHVAGTIAGRNNNIGVVGVAADATIVALKVMNKDGKGSISNVIAAVAHLGKVAKAGDVVNMSIGGGSSKTLDEEVMKVAQKGVLFAVAAGNEGIDCGQSSPARINHSNVFTISAMNDKDVYAGFSNYSSEIVDYCAPGTSISSTYLNGTYGAMTGTSMATPHVAGLLLLKGKNIAIDGYVKEDPDGKADPIAHK